MGTLLILAAVLIAVYCLYASGYGVSGSKRALAYVGTAGKTGFGAAFTACTGTVRRVIRLEAGRGYTFAFEGGIAKGSVAVSLLDAAGNALFTLGPERPAASLCAGGPGKYTLSVRYEGADGKFAVTWS